MRTVCKPEAMRIRAARQRVLPNEEFDFDARPSDPGDAEERMAGFERVLRAAEALQGCKSDEVRALLLKADGSSYAEIGELLGWTYTKVSRQVVPMAPAARRDRGGGGSGARLAVRLSV